MELNNLCLFCTRQWEVHVGGQQ